MVYWIKQVSYIIRTLEKHSPEILYNIDIRKDGITSLPDKILEAQMSTMTGMPKLVTSLWNLISQMFNSLVSWVWEELEEDVLRAFFKSNIFDMYATIDALS